VRSTLVAAPTRHRVTRSRVAMAVHCRPAP
jgi:hypothetical protein